VPVGKETRSGGFIEVVVELQSCNRVGRVPRSRRTELDIPRALPVKRRVGDGRSGEHGGAAGAVGAREPRADRRIPTEGVCAGRGDVPSRDLSAIRFPKKSRGRGNRTRRHERVTPLARGAARGSSAQALLKAPPWVHDEMICSAAFCSSARRRAPSSARRLFSVSAIVRRPASMHRCPLAVRTMSFARRSWGCEVRRT